MWRADGSWLDLSHVHEVHSIVVDLDYFGPLSVSLGSLAAGRVVEANRLPWIVSLHDLQVISRVLDRPAEFLAFLRRRTDRAIGTLHEGVDELDLHAVP